MTTSERLAYERGVLESTERDMAMGQPGFDYEFRGASLVGSFPDTRIQVRYWDPRYEREQSSTYAIWKVLVDADDTLEYPPARAGALIKVWALGG